jgi:DNA-directed RNA polymerase subunit omega
LEGSVLARVTIEDCLKNVNNRFTLVHLAAKRIRQVREGANLLVKSSNNKDVVTVLREIAANRIVVAKKTTDQYDKQ